MSDLFETVWKDSGIEERLRSWKQESHVPSPTSLEKPSTSSLEPPIFAEGLEMAVRQENISLEVQLAHAKDVLSRNKRAYDENVKKMRKKVWANGEKISLTVLTGTIDPRNYPQRKYYIVASMCDCTLFITCQSRRLSWWVT